MTQPSSRAARFSLKGYLLINGIVWVVLFLIYVSVREAWFSSVAPGIQRQGVSPVLLLIALAFLIASVYDFAFDRFRPSLGVQSADDQEAGERKDETEAPAKKQ
ncbi:MAG: hypothetical protein PWP23_100 [Candidatus Sumerlaeota bacterium]|nr:hypothetical protein [Candidatus Sumerlaeota bacterium]